MGGCGGRRKRERERAGNRNALPMRNTADNAPYERQDLIPNYEVSLTEDARRGECADISSALESAGGRGREKLRNKRLDEASREAWAKS